MDSRILFLGSCTGGAANQQLRATGGIVINTDGYQFMVDPGPAAVLRAKQFGINLRNNTALLISHTHLNHCNDANMVIGCMTHNGLDPKGVLISGKTFVKGNEDLNPVLTKQHQKFVERIITPDAGQKIGIEDIEIHALKTFHSDSDAIGFKFYTRDFILSYTGDTGYSKEIAEQYMNSDILILNMPNYTKKDDFNLNVEDVTKIIKKVQPRLAIITHFGTKVLKEDPILIARDIYHKTNVQVIAAKDGLVISPQSYSAELKQKTLNLYPSSKVQKDSQQDSQGSETALPDNIDLPFL